MTSFALRTALSTLVMIAGVLTIMATNGKPKEPTGEFLSFDAAPSPVCVNIGIPIVRISFRAKSSTNQCVTITINGTTLVSAFVSPEPGIQGANRCRGEGGAEEWGEEYAFSLNTIFGNNIPTSVTINGKLHSFSINPETVFDTRERSVTTQTCEPGFIPGG